MQRDANARGYLLTWVLFVLILLIVILAAGVLSFHAAATAGVEAEDGKPMWSYSACFLPDGSTKESYCTRAPLAQAQADCDGRLRSKKIEGTCACTDDQDFIGNRCD